MSQTEATMKTKYIKFSYRSPSKKSVKDEEDPQIPRIITTTEEQVSPTRAKRERDNDGNIDILKDSVHEGYTKIDENYYSKLDKNQYPFSSKYIPMKARSSFSTGSKEDDTLSPIINKPSVLLHEMQNYKTVSMENEHKWGEESTEIVEQLRVWRRLYKILDNKKRQLKKAQSNKNSSTTNFNRENGGGGSSINNSSNDSSSNGNEESEDQISSDNNVDGGMSRGNKRRKLSNGAKQEEEEEEEEGELLANGNGSSSNERKTRSSRSSR